MSGTFQNRVCAQITGVHPKQTNCDCTPSYSCLVSNYNFYKVNPWYPDSNYMLPVVPDTVCKWNHRKNTEQNTLTDALYWENTIDHIGVKSDPDGGGDADSIQIFQELPAQYDTMINYRFELKFGLTNEDSTINNRLLVCLTNVNPLTHFPHYSDEQPLYSAINIVQNEYDITDSVRIDRHYKYLVIFWAQPDISSSIWFEIHSVDLCEKEKLAIDAGNDDTLCKGDSVRLGGDPTAHGGRHPYFYYWNTSRYEVPPARFDSTANPWVKPTVTTKYYLTVFDQLLTSLTDSVLVTVNSCIPVLYADAGKDLTPCTRDSVTLGGAPTARGGVPPYGYTWTSIPPGFTSNLPNPVIKASDTVYYVLTVIDAAKQTKQDTIMVAPHSCFGWPRKIVSSPMIESMMISCDSIGDVLSSFCTNYWSSGQIEFIHDTTFTHPQYYSEILAFFDKMGNRFGFFLSKPVIVA